MAYKFVPYAPEGSGGRGPILGELVVTENGVYDEPVIGGGPVEIAVGKTVQFKKHITMDDIPEHLRPTEGENSYGQIVRDDFTNSGYNIGAETVAIELVISEPESLAGVYGYFDEAAASAYGVTPGWNRIVDAENIESLDVPPSILVANATSAEQLSEVSFFFEGAPTPADGWNKVTVNVAGDIIDVTELPTENIEEGKIYRISKESTPEIRLIGTDDGFEMNMTLGDVLSNMFPPNTPVNAPIYVVDSLPEVMEPMHDSSAPVMMPCYILESTGVVYCSVDGTPATAKTLGSVLGTPDGGWIDSVNSVDTNSDPTVYVIRGSSSTTYGIPDEANNKTVFEHNGSEWVECGAGGSAALELLSVTQNGTYTPPEGVDGFDRVVVAVAGSDGTGGDIIVVDVDSFPTENVDSGKIYRVAEESARVYVNLTADGTVGYMEELMEGMTIEYLVVDELPETMKESMFGQHFAVYFVRGVWEPMVNMMGQVGSLVTMLGGSFMGTVVDTGECTEEGVYTHLAATFAYGIPNPNGDMTIYQHNAEWENMTEKVGKLEAETTVLTEEVTSLRTSNETLEQKVYETEPYANFAQHAEVAAYDSGLLYVKSFNAPTGSGNRYRVKIPDYICTIAVESFRYKDDVTEPWEITELEGGAGLRNIGNYAFHGQTQLRKIVLPSVVFIGRSAFQKCRNIDQCDLPDNLEEIDEEAFDSAFVRGSMEHLVIPASVQTIMENAFKACTKLTSVTFKGTPKTLFPTAFNGCTNITDIYVPWAEGAVEGAPWGAPSTCTIHYNHTT